MARGRSLKHLHRSASLALLAASLSFGAQAPGLRTTRGPADTVFVNARVLTLEVERPLADGLALRDDLILAVGSLEELQPLITPETKVYDLGGRTILPGLNETHIHVRDLGFEQYYAVNLEQARKVADIQRLLRERLRVLERDGALSGWRYPTTGERGKWLFGLGWTQDRLEEKRMADRYELDAVSRDVPISLTRIYRGVAVNTKVFELLGIRFEDPSTYPEWFKEDPPDFEAGDIIFRDAQGLPNGVFVGERAPRLVARAIPEKTLAQKVDSLVRGLQLLASLGITAIVDPGSSLGRVTEVYQAAYDKKLLPVRVTLYDGWYRSGDPEGLSDPAEIERRLKGSASTISATPSSAFAGSSPRPTAESAPAAPRCRYPIFPSRRIRGARRTSAPCATRSATVCGSSRSSPTTAGRSIPTPAATWPSARPWTSTRT
jgi:hypothetical protein